MRAPPTSSPTEIVQFRHNEERTEESVMRLVIIQLQSYSSSFDDLDECQALNKRMIALYNFFSATQTLLRNMFNEFNQTALKETNVKKGGFCYVAWVRPRWKLEKSWLTYQRQTVKLILSGIKSVFLQKGLDNHDPLIIYNLNQFLTVCQQLQGLYAGKDFYGFEKPLHQVKTHFSQIVNTLHPQYLEKNIIEAGSLFSWLEKNRSSSEKIDYNKYVGDLSLKNLLQKDIADVLMFVAQLPDIQATITTFIDLSHAAEYAFKFQTPSFMKISYLAQRNIMVVFAAVIDKIQCIVGGATSPLTVANTDSEWLRSLLTWFRLLFELRSLKEEGYYSLPDSFYTLMDEKNKSLVQYMWQGNDLGCWQTDPLMELILSIQEELHVLVEYFDDKIVAATCQIDCLSQLLGSIYFASSLNYLLDISKEDPIIDGLLRYSACMFSFLAYENKRYASKKSCWQDSLAFITEFVFQPILKKINVLQAFATSKGCSYGQWKEQSYGIKLTIVTGLQSVCQYMLNFIVTQNDAFKLEHWFTGRKSSLLICLAEHVASLMEVVTPALDQQYLPDPYCYVRNISIFLEQVVLSIVHSYPSCIDADKQDDFIYQCKQIFPVINQVHGKLCSGIDFFQPMQTKHGELFSIIADLERTLTPEASLHVDNCLECLRVIGLYLNDIQGLTAGLIDLQNVQHNAHSLSEQAAAKQAAKKRERNRTRRNRKNQKKAHRRQDQLARRSCDRHGMTLEDQCYIARQEQRESHFMSSEESLMRSFMQAERTVQQREKRTMSHEEALIRRFLKEEPVALHCEQRTMSHEEALIHRFLKEEQVALHCERSAMSHEEALIRSFLKEEQVALNGELRAMSHEENITRSILKAALAEIQDQQNAKNQEQAALQAEQHAMSAEEDFTRTFLKSERAALHNQLERRCANAKKQVKGLSFNTINRHYYAVLQRVFLSIPDMLDSITNHVTFTANARAIFNPLIALIDTAAKQLIPADQLSDVSFQFQWRSPLMAEKMRETVMMYVLHIFTTIVVHPIPKTHIRKNITPMEHAARLDHLRMMNDVLIDLNQVLNHHQFYRSSHYIYFVVNYIGHVSVALPKNQAFLESSTLVCSVLKLIIQTSRCLVMLADSFIYLLAVSQPDPTRANGIPDTAMMLDWQYKTLFAMLQYFEEGLNTLRIQLNSTQPKTPDLSQILHDSKQALMTLKNAFVLGARPMPGFFLVIQKQERTCDHMLGMFNQYYVNRQNAVASPPDTHQSMAHP